MREGRGGEGREELALTSILSSESVWSEQTVSSLSPLGFLERALLRMKSLEALKMAGEHDTCDRQTEYKVQSSAHTLDIKTKFPPRSNGPHRIPSLAKVDTFEII